MRIRVAMLALCVLAGAAAAQDVSGTNAAGEEGATVKMSDLLKDGFEIKSAVPNGKSFIVFLQKDAAAFACEFSSLNNSRCGAIN